MCIRDRLYRAGVLRKLGRVDHRDAFLDTDSQERARGITIFAKQAVLTLPAAEDVYKRQTRYRNAAGVGGLQKVQTAQQRCFAGAGRADDGESLAFGQIKRAVAQHLCGTTGQWLPTPRR